jgi:ribose transport system substrate-binding protein
MTTQTIPQRTMRMIAPLAIALLGVTACGSSNAAPKATAAAAGTTETTVASGAKPATKPKVGLVMKSLSNEFFKQMQAGADTYASENSSKFDFKAVGMKDERDFVAQVDAVSNFIVEKYDIIVVAPADSKAMVTPLKKAVDAGITVINIDVPLDKEAMKQVGLDLPFFGPDNTEGARLVGEVLAQKLGKGGKVLLIEGNPEADNAKQRKAGFETAAKAGELSIVASETAHWETEEANTLVTNLLNKYPDVTGIMAANDSMAVGTVKALDSAGKSGKVQVVGFDNIPTVKSLIEGGKMLATVEQFGAKMAVFGIEYGLKTRAGEKFTGWIKTDIKLVDKSNIK